MRKILLDECVPRKFKGHLPATDCVTVPEAGWTGRKNGELLSLAEAAGFELFVTLDQGIEYEQNLTGRNIALVLIRAKSNRLEDLIPCVAALLLMIETLHAGDIVTIP